MKALAERTLVCESRIRSAFAENLETVLPSAAVAVGGFGRGELFPHSDIDLMLLVESEDAARQAKPEIAQFLRAIWDSGLRLSHSVHTVEECCQLHEGNTELSISLLDQRCLTGDESLYGVLAKKLPDFVRTKSPVLARHLASLTRLRHSKHHGTIYHLEPDVKDSPGGLRDLHVIQWLNRLLGKAFPQELCESRHFLFSLRYRLHQRAKRDNNVLNFEAQDALSEHPEALMRDFYRHARQIHRAALRLLDLAEARDQSLLSQFREWRSRLSNSDFTVTRDQVLSRSPQQLRTDVALVLRLFAFTARHGLALAPDTELRLMEFHPDPAAWTWAGVQGLFRMPRAATALRQMSEAGVLKRLMPEWEHIECLVVRDFYHRYTVDEHTIVALEMLEPPHDERLKNLMAETDRADLLRLAILFHDIGKGGGDHVTASAEVARRVMTRWAAPEDDIQSVVFLVANHLTLSEVMSKRDLDDPATTRELIAKVGTVERLKLLTLLTYADINAVYPGAMTPWRLEQLWRAYVTAHEELTRELETGRIHVPRDRPPEEATFLEGFPVRFLRTHSAAEIRKLVDLSREQTDEGAAVVVDRQHGAWRATVLADDRAFLFSSLAGALAGFGMNILKAEAFSNAHGVILDTFSFEDPHRNLELNPEEVDRLRETLFRVSLGKQDFTKMLEGRRSAPRPKRRLTPKVAFNNNAAPTATLVEVIAEDRPGLLYELTSAISHAGCDIDVVLIDTEAHKALDVFYVKHAGGRLPEELHGALKEQLLLACSR